MARYVSRRSPRGPPVVSRKTTSFLSLKLGVGPLLGNLSLRWDDSASREPHGEAEQHLLPLVRSLVIQAFGSSDEKSRPEKPVPSRR